MGFNIKPYLDHWTDGPPPNNTQDATNAGLSGGPPPGAGGDLQPATPSPAPAPASPMHEQQVQHRGILSDILHAVGDVLGGPTTKSVVNPDTGAIEKVPLTRGERIAHGIATGIVGAAAGAAQTGPGAIGKAGLAGAQAEQQIQQQNFQNTQEESKNVQGQVLQKFNIAHQNQMQLLAQRNSDLLDSQFKAKLAESNRNLLLTAQKEGYITPPIMVDGKDVNGQPGNEDAMMHFFTDKANHQAPTGYYPLYIPTTTDDGKIAHTVMYAPISQKVPITLNKQQMKEQTGLDLPGETFTTDMGSLLNMKSAYLDSVLKQTQIEHEKSAQQIAEEEAPSKIEASKAQTAHEYAEANLANQQAKAIIGNNMSDPFGEVSTLPQKELLKRQDAFQKDVVNKAYDTEKAYQMASEAYKEYQANGGHLPTGAQSMLLLSQHLGTTFGNVKGSRITKDMIAEHLGARGLTDTAVVAVQRIVNGDQLSPDQWAAFHQLISQSRQATWNNAVSSAKNQQLPIYFLPRGNGQMPIDKDTMHIYLDAADGDPAKAAMAARRQGWQPPQ